MQQAKLEEMRTFLAHACIHACMYACMYAYMHAWLHILAYSAYITCSDANTSMQCCGSHGLHALTTKQKPSYQSRCLYHSLETLETYLKVPLRGYQTKMTPYNCNLMHY